MVIPPFSKPEKNVPRLPELSMASWWPRHRVLGVLGYWPSIEVKSDDRPDEVAGSNQGVNAGDGKVPQEWSFSWKNP